ncbi:MAG TPA: hypothetical protein VN617_11835 [Rhodoferax sp.]|nr:hypothetical protein [Rhodoferax sp.]
MYSLAVLIVELWIFMVAAGLALLAIWLVWWPIGTIINDISESAAERRAVQDRKDQAALRERWAQMRPGEPKKAKWRTVLDRVLWG